MTNFDTQTLLTRLTRYAGPAELHLTVSLDNMATEKDRFKSACAAHIGKCIWIELDAGQTINQPMYGARFRETPAEQAERIQELVDVFSQDFSLQRIKVEAGPNNANIPQSIFEAADEPADCYFEHHVALELNASADVDRLKGQLAGFHGYLSRNAFKPASKAGRHIRFVTQRFSKIGQVDADIKLKKLMKYLASMEIEVVDIEREYNIYDSNLHLDQGWMR